MRIKQGFNGKELQLRVHATPDKDIRNAQLWIEFQETKIKPETLSYISLDELLNLRDEINSAIKSITGV